MQLREANEADIEDICHLFTSEQELFWIYPKGSYPFTPDQLRELYAVRRDLTVALHDDNVVGFANLYDFEPDSYVYIGNVVVAPEFRGKGLGRTLVAHNKIEERRDFSGKRVALVHIKLKGNLSSNR